MRALISGLRKRRQQPSDQGGGVCDSRFEADGCLVRGGRESGSTLMLFISVVRWEGPPSHTHGPPRREVTDLEGSARRLGLMCQSPFFFTWMLFGTSDPKVKCWLGLGLLCVLLDFLHNICGENSLVPSKPIQKWSKSRREGGLCYLGLI